MVWHLAAVKYALKQGRSISTAFTAASDFVIGWSDFYVELFIVVRLVPFGLGHRLE